VKLIVTVMVLEMRPSRPVATVTPPVESVAAAAQVALPPKDPLVVALQVALMAEAGIVVHPGASESGCIGEGFQRPGGGKAPPVMVKLTVAELEPLTKPKSGSVEEKVIVLGVAEILEMPVAAGSRL